MKFNSKENLNEKVNTSNANKSPVTNQLKPSLININRTNNYEGNFLKNCLPTSCSDSMGLQENERKSTFNNQFSNGSLSKSNIIFSVTSTPFARNSQSSNSYRRFPLIMHNTNSYSNYNSFSYRPGVSFSKTMPSIPTSNSYRSFYTRNNFSSYEMR